MGPHYTVEEIAKAWHVSRQSVTRMFEDEPEVLTRISHKKGGGKPNPVA